MINKNTNGDHETAIEINLLLIQRLMKNWPKRASVRGCYFDEFKSNDSYDPALPTIPGRWFPFGIILPLTVSPMK